MAAIEMDETRLPSERDALVEAAVLQQILFAHPSQLSLEELRRELTGDEGDFSERDAAERAVRDLAAAGLLHRSGDLLTPSRAALRFDALLGG
jgi:hypothetical protein